MKGTIKTISLKTKGIKMDNDVWYNPDDSVKDKVTSELKGKTVELTIIDPEKRIFNQIQEISQSKIQSDPLDNLAAVKAKRHSKGASLNTALKVLELSGKAKELDSEVVLAQAQILASKIEKWITENE